MSEPVVVIGAGGHAKVVVATLHAMGVSVDIILDDDEATWGREIQGIEVGGPASEAQDYGRSAVLAIGSNRDRQRMAVELPLEWTCVVHPTAWVESSVELGAGTVVFAGAVVQSETVIGDHTIINTGALIDHDCRVGAHSHVAPGASIAGGVCLGEGVLMGVGSSVIPQVSIGDWAVIGAGAAVVDDIEPGNTVAGVPARVLERD